MENLTMGNYEVDPAILKNDLVYSKKMSPDLV